MLPVRPGRVLPRARRIAEFWAARGAPFDVDLDRPACFACGSTRMTWNMLERAHLVGRVFNGLDLESNLVLLCNLCHRLQPDGDTAGEGKAALDYIQRGGIVGLVRQMLEEHG